MINHVRTLLLNADKTESRALDFPGEDIVPLDYKPVTLGDPLLSVYRILFGSNPDRAYKNWRLREYMTILHNSKLADHLTASDKRITYWPYDRPLGFNSNPVLGPNIYRVYGDIDIAAVSEHIADDANGKLIWTGVVDVEGGNNYSISVEVPQRLSSNGVLTFVNHLSLPIEVPGTSAKFIFSESMTDIKARFTVTLMARPLRGINGILDDLESVIGVKANGRAATSLFGTIMREPFKTYRNLWLESTPQLRLGGVLLSLARRIEENQ